MDLSENDPTSFESAMAGAIAGPVLVIEDHPLVAEATADLLRKKYPCLRISCVDSAHDARQYPFAQWFRIFADLEVPGAHGLSLIREIAEQGCASRCCVVTAFDRPALVQEARDLGVLGYIVKTSTMAQFVSSLDAVLLGHSAFPSESSKVEPRIRLTRRQLQLLPLLQRGYSSKQIAREWQISEGTVNNHVTGLLRALDVCNRAHAVARAVELHFLAVFEADAAEQKIPA